MQIKNRALKIIFLTAALVSISACSKKPQSPSVSQSGLRTLSASSSKKHSVSPLRIQMLRETALSVGARGGLAHRAKEINAIVEKQAGVLDRVFNFNGMMLDNNVLPPVLTEGRNSLDLASDDVIRISDRNYKIIKQARFVTAIPNWRDYLLLNYETPEVPDKSLLPKDRAEKIIWQKYIDEGWIAGIKQAELIFDEQVYKLTRDYNGMILYRTLLAKNMVSPPYVANLDLGVTGNESGISVNDRVLRITAKPTLKTNSKEWKTTVTRHD